MALQAGSSSVADSSRGNREVNDPFDLATSPPAIDHAHAALFLDFDGTLADLVSHPDDVMLLPATRAALGRLIPAFNGARRHRHGTGGSTTSTDTSHPCACRSPASTA